MANDGIATQVVRELVLLTLPVLPVEVVRADQRFPPGKLGSGRVDPVSQRLVVSEDRELLYLRQYWTEFPQHFDDGTQFGLTHGVVYLGTPSPARDTYGGPPA